MQVCWFILTFVLICVLHVQMSGHESRGGALFTAPRQPVLASRWVAGFGAVQDQSACFYPASFLLQLAVCRMCLAAIAWLVCMWQFVRGGMPARTRVSAISAIGAVTPFRLAATSWKCV